MVGIYFIKSIIMNSMDIFSIFPQLVCDTHSIIVVKPVLGSFLLDFLLRKCGAGKVYKNIFFIIHVKSCLQELSIIKIIIKNRKNIQI